MSRADKNSKEIDAGAECDHKCDSPTVARVACDTGKSIKRSLHTVAENTAWSVRKRKNIFLHGAASPLSAKICICMQSPPKAHSAQRISRGTVPAQEIQPFVTSHSIVTARRTFSFGIITSAQAVSPEKSETKAQMESIEFAQAVTLPTST